MIKTPYPKYKKSKWKYLFTGIDIAIKGYLCYALYTLLEYVEWISQVMYYLLQSSGGVSV